MEDWSHLDSLWSVDEEILESGVGPAQMENRAGEASASATQQEAVARNKLIKTRSARKNSSNVIEIAEEEGVKKLDHNAKERIRRMKLNASYLALQALLPDSRRSKVTINLLQLVHIYVMIN